MDIPGAPEIDISHLAYDALLGLSPDDLNNVVAKVMTAKANIENQWAVHALLGNMTEEQIKRSSYKANLLAATAYWAVSLGATRHPFGACSLTDRARVQMTPTHELIDREGGLLAAMGEDDDSFDRELDVVTHELDLRNVPVEEDA